MTQRRYDDDPEVRDRAPARDESWIPPLGPERDGDPLELPVFPEAPDDAELAAALAAVERDDDNGLARREEAPPLA